MVPSGSDSLGSSYVVAKLSTTSLPAAAILWLLSARLDTENSMALVKFVPRELNQWADDLSKGLVTACCPLLRRELPSSFFADVQAAAAELTGSPGYFVDSFN